MEAKKIHVVGAGLCGSLLALRLAQMGHDVSLFEKRPDLRKVELDAGRSINLALSPRGLNALSRAGLDDDVQALCIPMKGRMIHNLDKTTRFSAYSGRATDYINSISRPGLNKLLINELDKHDNARVIFDKGVNLVDFEQNILYFRDGSQERFNYLFGTDGVGSAVRRSMMPWSGRIRFDYSQDFLTHGYKELEIPAGKNGEHQLDNGSLHIWPRGDFMLIALPNMDGSFTVTLFLSFDGEEGFDRLISDEEIRSFFNRYFPDAVELMPDLIEDFRSNPTSSLSTIKCSPWKMPNAPSLLMGDAAHAIVPFYGQGMNASFEDVSRFEEVLEAHGGDFEKSMMSFSESRKINADAIADLAIDNFYEMRDHVDDHRFIEKRKIEMQLEGQYPDYYSKYSLVTFKPDLPYSEAMTLGRAQDEYLFEKIERNEASSIDQIYRDVMEHFSS